MGDHIAQRGAVCQHGAVAVDGSDAANAGQAALGDGGDRHIGPAVRDDAADERTVRQTQWMENYFEALEELE